MRSRLYNHTIDDKLITQNQVVSCHRIHGSGDIRRIMYTTNIIEGVNRQYRKATKTKSAFPSDSSLAKMLYLASQNIMKKWTQRYRSWDQVIGQLILLYDERLTQYL